MKKIKVLSIFLAFAFAFSACKENSSKINLSSQSSTNNNATVYTMPSEINSEFFDFYNNIIVSTVNGVPLYGNYVAFQLYAINEKTIPATIEALEKANGNEELRQEIQGRLQELQETTAEVIIKRMIRSEVAYQQAVKEELFPNEEEIYTFSKENFENLKELALAEDEDAMEEYQFLLDYFGFVDLSEEEYIEESFESYRRLFMIDNLKAKFSNESDYENYIDELVAKANIVIY